MRLLNINCNVYDCLLTIVSKSLLTSNKIISLSLDAISRYNFAMLSKCNCDIQNSKLKHFYNTENSLCITLIQFVSIIVKKMSTNLHTIINKK